MYRVRNIRRRGVQVAALLGFALLANPASALPLNFTCITNNNAADCAIGESQLSGDLTGNMLTVTMAGTADAVVEQIFIEGAGVTGVSFDSSLALGIVIFGTGAPGGNLPGGNQPGVNFTSAWNIAADNPAPKKGIGRHPQDDTSPQTGKFNLAGDLTDVRVGVHVIGFSSGGSESFVTGVAPVPEPNALLSFAVGALVVVHQLRRRR